MTDHAPTIALAPLKVAVGRRAASLALAIDNLTADYVLPVPPGLQLPPATMAQLTAAVAADPDADAFRLAVNGLPPDPLWRGRRARSHERNLESLRFADLFPFSALLVRRDVLLEALAELPADGGDDWWRIVCRRIGQAGRITPLDVTLRRGERMEGEAAAPAFVPLSGSSARVLVLGQIEVSTSLYFDFLEAIPDVSVAFRPLTRLALDAPVLASADLVILVRELHRFWDEGVTAFLDAAGVPYVWFTDDNFLTLKAEGAAQPFYAQPRMQAALAGAAAVWTSTDALAAAHAGLHPDVAVWKPVLDPRLARPASPARSGPLTVAISGGDFRLAGLSGAPLDVLRQIAGSGLRLLVTPAGERTLRPLLPAAEIVVLPLERSFRQHIRAWRRFGPDILLHALGATANAPFKSPTAAITADYLDAIPVVADEPAYEGWGEADGVLRIGASGGGLALAASHARQADWRADMGTRLGSSLSARFGPEGRVERLMALARTSPPRNATAVANNILESPAFARQQAARRLFRLARPLSDRLRPPG
ncbi:MAG TPA: hypothetical protein VKQ70_09020 [Caulobacteraceae bacterium]|jgi:hypothetical protein|nr:hypothetical protein [Caulobacteraceae bacterium]